MAERRRVILKNEAGEGEGDGGGIFSFSFKRVFCSFRCRRIRVYF